LKALNNILLRVDKSWRGILKEALCSLDGEYLIFLLKNEGYFPDIDNFLNAFKTLSLQDTRYILFGQDPYPRKESATGYAFIDGRVKDIFSKNGLSKEVNQATSLRNFIKMLLYTEGYLKDDLSQKSIASIDKNGLAKSIEDIRVNLERNGILLLNTALIFTNKKDSKKHIKKWQNFIETILLHLKNRKDIELILFGNAAKDILKYDNAKEFRHHKFLHPYNVDFIQDKNVHKLFKSMRLIHIKH